MEEHKKQRGEGDAVWTTAAGRHPPHRFNQIVAWIYQAGAAAGHGRADSGRAHLCSPRLPVAHAAARRIGIQARLGGDLAAALHDGSRGGGGGTAWSVGQEEEEATRPASQRRRRKGRGRREIEREKGETDRGEKDTKGKKNKEKL